MLMSKCEPALNSTQGYTMNATQTKLQKLKEEDFKGLQIGIFLNILLFLGHVLCPLDILLRKEKKVNRSPYWICREFPKADRIGHFTVVCLVTWP